MHSPSINDLIKKQISDKNKQNFIQSAYARIQSIGSGNFKSLMPQVKNINGYLQISRKKH